MKNIPVRRKLAPPRSAARPTREQLEADILASAKRLFARHGYDGVSLDRIATEAGTAKQNLLYYFASKPALYRRVLDGVLDVWLSYMDVLSHNTEDPARALREYIAGKLRFSRDHPDDSRVFAREVIAGVPLFADQIERRVIPAVQADVAVFNHWAAQGRCRAVDGRHLMVLLWACTQAYADFASQIGLVLGKAQLDPHDFDVAEQLIADLVLRGVLLPPSGGSDRSPA